MSRRGSIVICVQNLDCSGANQVIHNIVAANSLFFNNVFILSPKTGDFLMRFVEVGAVVRCGDHRVLLNNINDALCIICNTIMTADQVVEMVNGGYMLFGFYTNGGMKPKLQKT